MAESDTILQLGIEAAREGNREEARNLFTLLTRQEPNNLQAWLWLAGVAESPEERRAALEQVLKLDPNNEMAVKGLQAMGYPATPRADAPAAVAGSAATMAAATPPRAPLSDEERYAAELDSAFDDYDTVERAAPPPRNEPTSVGATEPVSSERPRPSARRVAAARQPSSGLSLSPLLLALMAAILLVIIGILVWPYLFGDTNNQTAGNPTAIPNATSGVPGATTGVGGTSTTPEIGTGTTGTTATVELPPGQPGGTTDPNQAGGGTTDPNQAGGGTTDPNQAGGGTTTDSGQPANYPDPAGATPAIVGVNTVVEANGYGYSFEGQNLCAYSCAGVVGPRIGAYTAQGTYVIALVTIRNNTGNTDPIGDRFFVLKDDQGRVYYAQPEVSNAYTRRGVNADRSMADAIPANGVRTSIMLVFDVQTDATGLTLFTVANQTQGWRILNRV